MDITITLTQEDWIRIRSALVFSARNYRFEHGQDDNAEADMSVREKIIDGMREYYNTAAGL